MLGMPFSQDEDVVDGIRYVRTAAHADGWGVPAKGMTGSGYSGHYFWDTEVYVMPFLDYTSPRWARNALRARSNMLPAARRRATQLSEAGALIPWRTIDGEEASAYSRRGPRSSTSTPTWPTRS